jgi:GntR family transcriptional regulator
MRSGGAYLLYCCRDTILTYSAVPLIHLRNLPARINWDSSIPPFRQVFGQINCLIGSGQLKQGDLLPQIRQLAAQLDANPNTIARAYNELERVGLIRKRQGSGCFVTGVADGTPPVQRLRGLRGRIEELAADAQAMGVPVEDLIAEFRRLTPEPVSRRDSKRQPVLAIETPASTTAAINEARPVPDLWPPVDALID